MAKHFDAIENLGCTSILCMDKTGTLTQNKMAVSHVWTGGQSLRRVVENKIQGSDGPIALSSMSYREQEGLRV